MRTAVSLWVFFVGARYCFAGREVAGGQNEEYAVLPVAAIQELDDGCRMDISFAPKEKWLGMVTAEKCPLSEKRSNLIKMGAAGMLVRSAEEIRSTLPPRRGAFWVMPVAAKMYRSLLGMYREEQKRSATHTTDGKEAGNKKESELKKDPSGGRKKEEGERARLPTVKISSPSVRPVPMLQIVYVAFLILMIFVFPMIFDRLEEAPTKILKPGDLFKLPRKIFSDLMEAEKKYEECPICFDAFHSVSSVRTLQCSHYFHAECIDPWLLGRSSRCPICNRELVFS